MADAGNVQDSLKWVRIVCTNLDTRQADWRATRERQTATAAECRSPKVRTLGVNAVVRRERARARVRA